MSTPAEIHREAFSKPRDPRSPAYKAGALAGLEQRGGRALPYRLGSAEADAWFAGYDEGRALRKRHSAA